MANIEELKNKIVSSIERIGNEELIFNCKSGEKYRMYHEQDCCEDVRIEEIHGDINDLIDTMIIEAREDVKENETEYRSEKWTFYNFRTIKGSVTIRWLGESNLYYSESVYFRQIN